jgi:hypothetical protein
MLAVLDTNTQAAYVEHGALGPIFDNRDLYCAIHGHKHLKFFPDDIKIDPKRLDHWRKVVAILGAFKLHQCDCAVWLDTDVAVMHAQGLSDIYEVRMQ